MDDGIKLEKFVSDLKIKIDMFEKMWHDNSKVSKHYPKEMSDSEWFEQLITYLEPESLE